MLSVFYRVACGAWQISPAVFWKMSPEEFWELSDFYQPEEKIGDMPKSTFDMLLGVLNDV